MANLSKLALLRVIVAYLGEHAVPPWWASTFTHESGLDFSRYNFVRSHVSAAVAGAVVVARGVHDHRIGRRGIRHLFRFDAGLERAIHRQILEAERDQLAALIGNQNLALDQLGTLATQTVQAPEGPVQVGHLGEEEGEPALVDLAAHYLDGFENGKLVLPYFAGGKT